MVDMGGKGGAPGTWHVDQVGVKAPGRLTKRTFDLPLMRSATVIALGNPTCTTGSTGKVEPTETFGVPKSVIFVPALRTCPCAVCREMSPLYWVR